MQKAKGFSFQLACGDILERTPRRKGSLWLIYRSWKVRTSLPLHGELLWRDVVLIYRWRSRVDGVSLVYKLETPHSGSLIIVI